MEEEVESAESALMFAVLPIAKVLIMCSLGVLMASPYVGILNSSARQQLSKLVFNVFLPCLIFTQLGQAVTWEKILEWWFIPVNVVVAAVIGCTIGFIVAFIVKPPREFFGLTVVMVGIGNIGNIPLVIIGAICRDSTSTFGPHCSTDGVAYISFGQWVGALIVYTFAHYMLSPPDKVIPYSDNSVVVKVNDPNGTTDLTTPLLSPAHQETVDEDHEVVEATPSRLSKIIGKTMYYAHRSRLIQILQPPVLASFFALFFGATPWLKKQLYEEHAPFYFLYDALSMMGSAMIPCIMLVLGGNLVGGAGNSRLGLRTTVAITFVRLFVMPAIGIGVVTAAEHFGFLPPGDKMFKFVLLLQHSMPSSILAGAVTNLHGHAEKETSAILFWEHVISVVSIAGWLTLIVYLL